MQGLYDLMGVSEKGEYVFRSPENTLTIAYANICDYNGIKIEESSLLQSIQHQFVYHQGKMFYKGLGDFFSKVYFDYECDRNNRVPISSTCFQGFKELEYYFISNKYYSSFQAALTLGLCEAAIRSSLPSYLKGQLPIFKALQHQNKNLKNFSLIQELFRDSAKVKETYLLLQQFYPISSVSLQAFCNKFSVGIYYYTFADDSLFKEFRLPENPEISPIPILKILCLHNYYFVLYARDENQNDGFSDDGKRNNSYQNDELQSSFYMFKTETYLEESVDLLTNLLKIVTENPKNEGIQLKRTFDQLKLTLNEKKNNSNEETKSKIEATISSLNFLNNYIEKKMNAADSQNNAHNIKIQAYQPNLTSAYPNYGTAFDTQSKMGSKPQMLSPQGTYSPNMNTNMAITNFNNGISGNNTYMNPIENHERPNSSPISNNFEPPLNSQGTNRLNSANYTQPPNIINSNIPASSTYIHKTGNHEFSNNTPGFKTEIPQLSPQGTNPPLNLNSMQIPNINNNFPGSNPNNSAKDSYDKPKQSERPEYSSYTLNSRNSTKFANESEKKCPGCDKIKFLKLFHGNCTLCNNCIALSIDSNACINCNNTRIRDIIVTFKKEGFHCNGCGMKKSEFKVNTMCNCIICENCSRNQKFDNHRLHSYT